MNNQEFLVNSKKTCEYIVDYNERLVSNELPVMPKEDIKAGYLRSLLPNCAPEDGEPYDMILKDLDQFIMPGVTQWHHPNFFGYFPTAKSYASLLGDVISGTIACIGFSWVSCPACTELEVIVLDWLVRAMKLPSYFLSTSQTGGGVIQGSASMASAMIVMAMRSKKLRDHNITKLPGAFTDRLVVYFSEEAHSSVERACQIALVQYRKIKSKTTLNAGMCCDDLESQIKSDISNGLCPMMVVGTLGTTGSCAFDNIDQIGDICDKYKLWFHIDAAYFGSGLVCEEYQYLIKGIHKVHSFNFNLHKLGLVIFDCSILYVKDKSILADSFVLNPQYLVNDANEMPEYRHWEINLGRRFRSLKIWFTLRTHGLTGLRHHVRKHTRMAKLFGSLIGSNLSFEIVNNVEFGLVCFRAKGSDDLNRQLFEEIQRERKIFLVTSSFKSDRKEKFYLRFTSSISTEEENVRFAYEHVSGILDILKLKQEAL